MMEYSAEKLALLESHVAGGLTAPAGVMLMFTTAAANLAVGRSVVVSEPLTPERANPAAWPKVTRRLGLARTRASRGPSRDAGAAVLVGLVCPWQVLLDCLRPRGDLRNRHKLAKPERFACRARYVPPVVPHLAVDATFLTEFRVDRAFANLGVGRDRDANFDSGSA
jgi:hypothetical protein